MGGFCTRDPACQAIGLLGGSRTDKAALQVGYAHDQGNRLPWTNGQVEAMHSKGQPLTEEQVKQQLSTMAHETHKAAEQRDSLADYGLI